MKKNMLVMSFLVVGSLGTFTTQAMNYAKLGNFSQSCEDIHYNPQTKELTCTCINEHEKSNGPTSYDISDCKLGTVQNINGSLCCALPPGYCKKKKQHGNPLCCMLTPVDQYTTLMEDCSSLAKVKQLILKGADINAATWQYHSKHYVTALDRALWNYSNNPVQETLDCINFLKSKGAKSAKDLPGFNNFIGAVRPSK